MNYTCYSRNERGQFFIGYGWSLYEAERDAIWNCQYYSRYCWIESCN
jgi:hypothetical protein